MAGEIKHSWTGTVLTITSDSGTSSCDLKGEKGDDGCRGAQGVAGAGLIDNTLSKKGFAADAQAMGEQFNVINGRIDGIIALPDGSTTADAELRDLRLNYKGNVYGSAGTAVRNSFIMIDNRATALENDVEDLQSSQTQQDKRLLNIEKRMANEPFEIDNSTEAIKVVPAGAMPYAAINKVGGMSYKSHNLLNFNDSQTTTETTRFVFQYLPIKLEANKTYTLSFHTNVAAGHGYQLSYKTTSGAYASFEATRTTSDTRQSFIFTVPVEDIEALSLYFNVIGATVRDFMVNEGNKALEYVPYYEGIRSAAVTKITSTPNLINEALFANTSGGNYTEFVNGQIHLVNTTGTAYSSNKITLLLPKGNYYLNMKANAYAGGFIVAIVSDGIKAQYLNGVTSNRLYFNVTTPMTLTISLSTNNTNTVGDSYANLWLTPVENGEYKPYKENVLAIPTNVIATTDYGLGINENYYNYIDWERKVFVRRCVKLTGFTKNFAKETVQTWTIARPAEVENVSSVGLCSFNVPYQPSDADAPHWYKGGGSIWIYAPIGVDVSNAEVIVPLTTPEETNISAYLPDDNFIEVIEGGAVIAVNEYNYDTPYEIEYMMGG